MKCLLISKLGLLNNYYELISDHYKRFVGLVDFIKNNGDKLKKDIEKNLNGNSHGLN